MADLWSMSDDFHFPETMNKLPEDLKSKLMLIDCELLYGKDDWWMSEVLFTPSEYHLDFLQWILTNFNESLANYFQQPQSSLDSPHEVQAQRILALCSTLGLCDSKDENLIKGKAPYHKLLNFWQHLIDIFLIRTNRNNKVNGNISRSFSKDLSFEDKVIMDNQMLNSICERDFYGNNAFKVDTSIIPSDLYRKMNLQGEILNGEELSSNLACIKSRFERQELEINKLRQNDSCNILVGGDFTNAAYKEQNINRVLLDLEKMALQFTQCHEDLKPWFKSEPQFKYSALGQKFQEACDKLEEFTNALNQLSNFKESYHCLDKSEQSLNHGLDNHCVIKDYLGSACDILTS